VTTGACLAVRRKFSATEFWADCVAHGATAMCYIGEVPRYLMNTPPGPHDRAHRVRRMVGVGLRAELWRPFMARFGVERVCETYAASEGNTVFLNALNLDETIGFCPTPHALVRYDVQADAPLRDAAGRMQRVQPGEAGLLLGKVTPRFQFDGYTDPVASEKKLFRDVFAAGDVWFNSGDLLRKVGWGHAQFVDRVGDTFRWKGENVSTNEVELVISQVEGVAEATVYGVELAGAEGRVGMAAVVPVDPAIEGDALAARVHDACRAALPPYAVPAFVRLLGRLETTGTFKHQKAALRAQGWRADAVGDPVFVFLPGTVAPQRVAPATEAAIAAARW
jgi:acyl-CoA synthetase (AMP-forming)/AMP-acid ligase II